MKSANTFVVSIALALASLSSSAFAAVDADAKLSNARLQLIDLDLNDGITPEIQFWDSRTIIRADLANYNGPENYHYSDYRILDGMVPVSNAFSYQGNSLRFQTESNGYSNLSAAGVAQAGSYFHSEQGFDTRYTLTANTALVVSGNLWGAYGDSNLGGSSAYAYVELSRDDDWSFMNEYGIANHHFGYAFDKDFNLTMRNTSTQALTGRFHGVVQVDGWENSSSVPNIPEPETYAMMLAGLGLLSVVARKRKA